MNEGDPLKKKSEEEIKEEENVGESFLHVYEAEFVNKQKREEKLREFYVKFKLFRNPLIFRAAETT